MEFYCGDKRITKIMYNGTRIPYEQIAVGISKWGTPLQMSEILEKASVTQVNPFYKNTSGEIYRKLTNSELLTCLRNGTQFYGDVYSSARCEAKLHFNKKIFIAKVFFNTYNNDNMEMYPGNLIEKEYISSRYRYVYEFNRYFYPEDYDYISFYEKSLSRTSRVMFTNFFIRAYAPD